MTTQEALLTLAEATANAAAETLRDFAPGSAEAGEFEIPLPGRDPFETALPAVVASVQYEGVQGGLVFVMPVRAARRLVATIGGAEAPAADDEATELTEDELAALTDPVRQMLAAATAATSVLFGSEVVMEAPSLRVAPTAREVKVGFQGATRTTTAEITVLDEVCRLVQLVPSIFTMRMTNALSASSSLDGDETGAEALRATMRNVPLRVWAELGRARLRTLDVAALADGAIVDLDRAADDPVDVYVNGSRIATGRLIRIDDKDWAVRLEQVFPAAQAPEPANGVG